MKYCYFLALGVRENSSGIYEWRILELIDGQLCFVRHGLPNSS